MKIMMVTSSLDMGGAETHVVELARALFRMGHEVFVSFVSVFVPVSVLSLPQETAKTATRTRSIQRTKLNIFLFILSSKIKYLIRILYIPARFLSSNNVNYDRINIKPRRILCKMHNKAVLVNELMLRIVNWLCRKLKTAFS